MDSPSDAGNATFCAVRSQRQARLQAALEDLLLTIVRIVNEKKEHIPPVVSANTLTFPFDISIAGYSSHDKDQSRKFFVSHRFAHLALQMVPSEVPCPHISSILKVLPHPA